MKNKKRIHLVWQNMKRSRLVWLTLVLFISAAAIFSVAADTSAGNMWKKLMAPFAASPAPATAAQTAPQQFNFQLQPADIQRAVSNAPLEASGMRAAQSPSELTLPMPDGRSRRYRLLESPIITSEMATKYPDIKSYTAQGVDDPSATARFSWTSRGLHGVILGNDYSVFIHPVDHRTTTNYVSGYAQQDDKFECSVTDSTPGTRGRAAVAGVNTKIGGTLRTYRIAVASPAEYTNDPALGGGSVASAVASFNVWLNGMNAIFERDLSVRFMLVNNTSIIYTDAATDPFTNPTSTGTSLTEIRDLLRTQVGIANYDVGHVLLQNDTGGVAFSGVACDGSGSANKGGGASGMVTPLGAAYGTSRLAHETAHQFGASHTFNDGEGSGCASNRSASTSYESGGGLSILAYPHACFRIASTGGNGRSLFFHDGSLTQMVNFIGSRATCATPTLTGNTPPTVSGGPDRNIPRNTPFTLTAAGSDADVNDAAALTYAWEQIDSGNSLYFQTSNPASWKDAGDPPTTTRPIFRPFNSSPNPARTFPSLTYILNNANVPPDQIGGLWTAEHLPNVTRQINFRIVLRDNRAGGGAFSDDHVVLNVDGNSGPFLVTSPNTAVSLPAGSMQTVTWSVNNTNLAPVNCANVKISLSTDGGQTFPTVLAASTPNDGSESVTLPNLASTAIAARIKVEAIDNVFFDISDANFTIASGPSCPTVSSFAPAAGNTGTSVRIFGAGFTSVTAVKFSNNVTATFTVNSDNQITVTQPAGATSGPITISKASCADTQTSAYIVCPSAPVTLSIDDNAPNQINAGRYLVNRLTPASYPATLQSISIRIESTQNLVTGTPFILLAGVNTDGDANINNTSFQTTNATVGTLSAFVKYDLAQPITISSGDFVVGYIFPNGGTSSLLDTTTPQSRSYSSDDGLNFTLNTSGNYFIRAGILTGCGLGAAACPTVSGISPSSGQIGDTVTINGAGFSGVSAVKFNNNIIANFTVVSDTQITALVPPGTTSGAITISEPTCSDVLTASFTVNAPACMTVSGISPASALPGVPITITGTNFTGASVVKFSSDAAAAFTVDSPTQITAIVPPGVTFGPITISKQGCADVQTVNFTPCNTNLTTQIDDGTVESAGGFTGPVTLILVNRLTPAVYPATLTTVQIAVHTTSLVPVGTAMTIRAAANPTGGTAISSLSFQTQAGTVGTLGQFISYTLTNPITINSGDFVIGYSIAIPTGNTWWFDARDTGIPQGRSYGSTNGGSTYTLANGNSNYLIRGVYQRPCCSGVTVAVNPTNPALPGAMLGTPYSQTFTQTGGAGTATWSVSAGALPAGLTLNTATGALTGAPTAIGTSNFTIRATDQNNCAGERAYTLAVTCPAIAVSPGSLPDGTVGAAYSQNLSALPTGSYTFAVTGGALPGGLALGSGGDLTGTPTQSGTFNFTVTATGFGGACAGTRTYAMTVGCPAIAISPSTLPDGVVGAAYNQSLTGGSLSGAYTFAVTGGALPTGLMLAPNGTLSGSPTTATGSPFNFTITATHTASGCTGSRTYVVNVACPTIALAPTTLPGATIGDSYNQTITATPAGSYTFAVTGGALPGGLTLAANGALSGTTSAAGAFNFTITATGVGGCTGQQSYAVTVASPYCAPTPANLTTWWKAENNASDVLNTNNGTLSGSASFAAGKVGQAFSFNGTNGYVLLPQSAFPTSTGGNQPFTFELWFKTSSGGIILGQADTLPYTGLSSSLPNIYVGTNGKLYTEMFCCQTSAPSAASVNDNVFHHVAVVFDGTNEITYLDGSAIKNIPYSQTGFSAFFTLGVGASSSRPNTPGGWWNFTGLIDEPTMYSRALTAGEVQSIFNAGSLGKCCAIAIAQTTLPNGVLATTYNQTITTTGNLGTVSFTSSGTLPPGLTLSSGGVLSGAPTQSGLFNFTVTATDSTSCATSQAYTVAINCPTISFSPNLLPVASVGTAYSQTITASPGSYSFAVTAGALPAGVTLSVSGDLSGTPSQTGTFAFTVTATNTVGGCSANQIYQLQVNCPIITLSPGVLPNGTVGVAYSQTITVAGLAGSYSFTLDDGALPAGLTLNPTTGVLSGSPTASGTFNIVVRATHTASGCVGNQAFTLNIVCPTIGITPTTLPTGMAGTPYPSTTLTASGGASPYTFTVSVGALPKGLTLSAAGVIDGTTSVFGTFNFTVRATDNNGCFGERAYSLVISPPCGTIIVNPSSLPNGFVGTAYSQSLSATGGASPYTFTVSAGALPGGLNISGANLTGTPTTTGTFSFTIQATDNNGCVGTRAYTVIMSGNGLQFYPLARPIRLLDTRAGQVACIALGTPITGGTSLTIPARGTCEALTIPANAAAITGNITTVNPPTGGYLAVYPSNVSNPGTSASQFRANLVINNAFTTGLGPADGAFKVFASSTTELIIDITGYFAPPGAGGLFFHTLPSPVRLLDTRAGQTACTMPGAPILANQNFTQQASGTCGIPSGAVALVGNATTVGPQAQGFLTLFPADATSPGTSNGNYVLGQTLNSPFTVGLSSTGQFKIYSSQQTNLIVDVVGYYSAEVVDTYGAGLLFTPITPIRLLDTRVGAGACFMPGAPIPSQTDTPQAARGTCSIQATAQAVVGHATVIAPATNGFLTFWPSNAIRPNAASSNYQAGISFNRHFTTGLGTDGAFLIYSSVSLNMVLDMVGSFAP